MVELYTTNLIKDQTLEDLFYNNQQNINNLNVGGTYVGTSMIGGSYKSAESGARVDILQDPSIGIACYNATGIEVFKVMVDGTDIGDVILGNYAGGQGAKYDSSIDTFSLTGAMTAGSIAIGTSPLWFKVDTSGNIWSGNNTLAGAITSNFAVTNVGALYATSATISGSLTAGAGSSIGTSYLSGIVGLANTNVAAQGWTFTGTFSASSYRKIAWTTGTFTTAGGTGYSISSGDTGNIATTTYIYLDTAVSSTVLQTTTTATIAIGSGKVLIAVASPNTDTTSSATIQTFGGRGGQILLVDNLAANSTSSNEFVSNTAQVKDAIITNAKITSLVVDKLIGGTITSQQIVLTLVNGAGDVYISCGKTDFTNTENGFILGMDDSDSNKVKFIMGGATEYISAIDGAITITGTITATAGAIGGWTINATSITDTAGVVGMSSAITVGDDIRFWAGNATPSSAPFKVTEAGALTASSGTIGGWTLGSTSLTGTGITLSSTGDAYLSIGTTPPTGVTTGTGIFINKTGFFSLVSNVQTSAINTDGTGWFGLTGNKAISWTAAGVATVGGLTANSTSLWQGGTGVYQAAATTLYVGQSGISLADKFSVTTAGALSATSGTIGGCTLGATSIGSTTFVSGPLGSGWNISNAGTVEFQNAIIRGTIRTSVFEKDTISCVNGIVLVSSADVLTTDMTAADNSTVTISGQTTFSANEVIRIKDGTDDEWMLVTGVSGAPTYVVTRDLAGSYPVNTNPIWKKGTTVVSMGVGTGTKTGFVLLDSSSANSPYIDIYGRNSNTYTDYTLHGRFGWLKGITDTDVGLNTTDVWGLYTDNAYIKGVIVANTGYIGGTGGWVISTNYIKDVAGVVGLSSVVTGGDDIRIWAGHATPASAPFYITESGAMVASSATITGVVNATSGKFGTSTNYWSVGATGLTAVSASTDVIINYGKTDFGQDATAGFILGYDFSASLPKIEFGVSAAKMFKYDGANLTLTGGVIDGTSTIGGRVASTLASAIDSSGHFADSAINTATSTIVTPFTFGVSGALQIGTYVNGVSGDLKISPTGILARSSTGATTFSIDGTTGVAVLNGLVVGTNVGLGTAQDAGQVTTIVGNTVTTGFVNALNVTAASMSVAGLTAGTINSKIITLAGSTADCFIAYGKTDFGQDATGGFILGYDYSASVSKFEIGSSATKVMKYDGTDWTLVGGTITGGTIQTAATGKRIVMTGTTLTAYDSSDNVIGLVSGDGFASPGSLVAQSYTNVACLNAISQNVTGTVPTIYVRAIGLQSVGSFTANNNANTNPVLSVNQLGSGTNHAIDIVNDGTGKDIDGHNSTWGVTPAGRGDFTSLYGNSAGLLISSYSEANNDGGYTLNSFNTGYYGGAGQSFLNNAAQNKITSAKFYLKKSGSPTGTAIAKLWSHTGTYGTSSVPLNPPTFTNFSEHDDEANIDGYYNLYSGSTIFVAQSFIQSASTPILGSVQFGLKKYGSPTGLVVAKLYAETGDYSTTSTPTGAVLATSDIIEAASLTTSEVLYTFHFSGVNQLLLTAPYYCLAIEYSGGDSSNYVMVGKDASTPPILNGNASYSTDGTNWTAVGGTDLCFFVYRRTEGAGLLATSGTLDVSTLTTDYALKTFTFTGTQQYAMAANTNYVITIEYSSGDATNYILVGNDSSTPTHTGNACTLAVEVPTAVSGTDLNFYIYGTSEAGSIPVSTDSGVLSISTSTTNTITLGYQPKLVIVNMIKTYLMGSSYGYINAKGQGCSFSTKAYNTGLSGTTTSYCCGIWGDGSEDVYHITAVGALTSTGFTITSTKGASCNSTMNICWTAFA